MERKGSVLTGLPAFIAALPKVELHLHLEGAVDAATFARLLARHGERASEDAVAALFDFSDLGEFLAAYGRVCGAMRDAEDFELATLEALRRCAAGGARYVELFFSSHAHAGLSYVDMLAGIEAGADAAAAECGVETRLIPAHSRELGPERGLVFLEEVLTHRTARIAGIGLDYQERPHPPAPFAEMYRRARAAGLGVTAHAGEDGPADYVRDTVVLLGCRRVDHGYHIVDDPDLMAGCRDAGIDFTVCPTTTTHTTVWRDLAAPDHAIRRMIAAGLNVVVNTDDPGLFRTDLNREYELLARHMSLSPQALGQIALNGLRASWMAPERKSRQLSAWSAEIETLVAAAGA